MRKKSRREERRLTVVSKRRAYDQARLAHVFAAYVLARLADTKDDTEASA